MYHKYKGGVKMAHYIIELTEKLISIFKSDSPSSNTIFDYTTIISEELNELHNSFVAPHQRYDFVVTKQFFKKVSSSRQLNYAYTKDTYIPHCENLIEILENYGMTNSIKNTKDFSFINDKALRDIVERDYKELTHILIPDGAWKSSVILAGSILEAILYDQLNSSKHNEQALNCGLAPMVKDTNKVKKLKDWSLQNMIAVAESIGCLPPKRAKSIDQVLRDYRNFVHPLVELRSEHPCTDAEAYMAKGGLDGVINHFNSIQVPATP